MNREISKKELLENDIISHYATPLDILSQTTDDYLFLLDIEKDVNRFFGDISAEFSIDIDENGTNTTDKFIAVVHPNDREVLLNDINDIRQGKKDFHNIDYRLINKNGKSVWVSCRGAVIRDLNGNPLIMIGRISREALAHMYNPLTGLFNQIKLLSDIKIELPQRKSGYIILVDIDDLSAINLTHGRAYGDDLLITIASLMEKIPSISKVYHTERNYFAGIVEVETDDNIREIYSFLCDSLSEKCTITTAALPYSSEIFSDEDTLYNALKLVMSKAKDNGRRSLKFYKDEEFKQKITSVSLLEEFQESVNNNFEGFYLNYQPQVTSSDYKLFSVEALLRYTSKSSGRIFPDEFIPLLESTKLIIPVGLWVLKTALLQCKEWRKYIRDLHISVNFSVVQLRDKNIVSDIFRVLDETDMNGDCLTIEVTESIPADGKSWFISIISELKKRNIQIAIDDFGTGYSNLGYLRDMEIDEIKIDRMFIKDIEKDTYNYRLVENTISFAKTNSIRSCCEGVETPKELAFLESSSPDIIQGYLFDKPCFPEEIYESYMDPESAKYKTRIEFLKALAEYKSQTSPITFNPKNILRDTNVGLWIIRTSHEKGINELHIDDTMETIMGIDKKLTPSECYKFWHDRIREDYAEYINENLLLITTLDKVVQLEYPWNHPTMGEVMVRSNGKLTKREDDFVIIEGYHRILSNIKTV